MLYDDELDSEKLKRLKIYILTLEKENIKTKEKSRTQMVDEIKKCIEKEVNKKY